MELSGRNIVVTGGAGGIGQALVRRFVAEGARAVVIADRDLAGTERLAQEVGGLAVQADLSTEGAVLRLIEQAEAHAGPIDVFFSNAGVAGPNGGPEVGDSAWLLSWNLHVMAHVWATRAVLPGMLARGEGYLVNTASAAGLLANVRAAPYSVTKHAAVALAEWLSIAYHDRGVRSSCVCPLGVRTPMLLEDRVASSAVASGETIEPEAVAAAVVEGMREDRCLILPHPQVRDYMLRRGDDHERWLRGMRRMAGALDGLDDQLAGGA